ncbi:hydroxyethylthiazole kinase [Ruminiclostridium hungatei]|uniref:Hydroxyethylthiazole kinase n=1 Tax=Ruminiclostridium hungatei TaxID=48256 RepID=A0A1V4SJV4_RUMHU|nr:hydroxyethylthiazole kinase [Ruminiclostridium hungatei]OPX44150.1 hydroxyethylthiazole kinase [Ruminiclostridium hungatei]
MRDIIKTAAELLTVLRNKKPLVHNITNYVTVNDCANIILAVGASPIMADDLGEAADITAISSALVLNIGTLNRRTLESMLASGKKANLLGIPVIFDPVGAGASALRNEATKTILTEIKVGVLRGNMSEISHIAGLGSNTKGVDASEEDIAAGDALAIAVSVSKKLRCVTAITGATDIITDGNRIAAVSNGHKMLSGVTGTGCMTTALIGAYCGAGEDAYTAAVAGIASMGLAGELAYEAAGGKGTGSFHVAIIDAISRLDEKILLERARIHEK